VAAFGFLLGGCSNKQMPLDPTSISPGSPAVPAPPSTGASISGLAHGPNAGASIVRSASTSTSAIAGLKVGVSGTTLSTMTDSGGQCVLNGVPAGSVSLTFEGAGINAIVLVGTVANGQQITVSVTVNGSNATLDSHQTTSGGNVEIEGVVGGLTGICPAVT